MSYYKPGHPNYNPHRGMLAFTICAGIFMLLMLIGMFVWVISYSNSTKHSFSRVTTCTESETEQETTYREAEEVAGAAEKAERAAKALEITSVNFEFADPSRSDSIPTLYGSIGIRPTISDYYETSLSWSSIDGIPASPNESILVFFSYSDTVSPDDIKKYIAILK